MSTRTSLSKGLLLASCTLLLLGLCAAALGRPSNSSAAAVDPRLVPGNPTCADLGYDLEKKIDPPSSGTFPLDGGSVTVSITGGTYFNWTATIGMDAVIAKGGPNANVYEYDPESFGDNGLHAPIKPDTGRPYGLSHISFCYDLEPDVEKVSLTVGTRSKFTGECTRPAPTRVDVSESVEICTVQTLRNNGPSEVDVLDVLTVTEPPGCTISPTEVEWRVSIPAGDSVKRDDDFTLHCSQPSDRGFTFEDHVEITTEGVTDSNPNNNSASASLGFTVWAYADLKIVDQYVACIDLNNNGHCDPGEPAGSDPNLTIPVDEDVPIVVQKIIRNKGPYGPVDAETVKTATFVPALGQSWDECTITPAEHAEQIWDIPVSEGGSVIINEPFTIRCDKPSHHEFKFRNKITVKDPHVVDPSCCNSADFYWTVAVVAEADLEIQQEIIGPDKLDVSSDGAITVKTVVTNNGPYGPVAIDYPLQQAFSPYVLLLRQCGGQGPPCRRSQPGEQRGLRR